MAITDFLLKDLNKFERSDIEEVKDIENLDNDNSNDAIAIQYRSKQEIVREDPYEITRIANKREFRTIDNNNHKFKNERSEIDQIQDFMEECDEELKSMNYTLNKSRPFEELKVESQEGDYLNNINSELGNKNKLNVSDYNNRNIANRSMLIPSKNANPKVK